MFDLFSSEGVFVFGSSIKTAEEEVTLVQNGVPNSTQYKSKWAYGIFKELLRQRLVRVLIIEVVGLFKNYDYHHVGSLETPLAPVPEKTISAHQGLNPANRGIKFVLRLDCVPQNKISTIPGIK